MSVIVSSGISITSHSTEGVIPPLLQVLSCANYPIFEQSVLILSSLFSDILKDTLKDYKTVGPDTPRYLRYNNTAVSFVSDVLRYPRHHNTPMFQLFWSSATRRTRRHSCTLFFQHRNKGQCFMSSPYTIPARHWAGSETLFTCRGQNARVAWL